MNATIKQTVDAVTDYWDAHTLGLQYVKDKSIEPGSAEFFEHIRPWSSPYKFPWLMERIEHNARLLRGKRLLEIGCGMGFVSVEFSRRDVQITATDLTPAGVELTKRHFDARGLQAEKIRTANALDLDFEDETFDAVWSNGVLHATGDTARAVDEVYRVLKPGGRAIISHFYRRPSWMYTLHRVGRENIEFEDKDPPVNEFYTEREVLNFFRKFKIEDAVQEHYRALPIARSGLKATLYRWGFRPAFNLLPVVVAKRLAYKFSVTAIKS